MRKTFSIAIHGGASNQSLNKISVAASLKQVISHGHQILKKGGSALDAVEETVKLLEDDPLFNAGRGSTLNCKGVVEMDASIMNGRNLKAGAVSMVQQVKNPISLARAIMNHTHHVFLSGYGALEIAKRDGLSLESNEYFITQHEYKMYRRLNKIESMEDIITKTTSGTVGAVARDKKGNLAAGTSTGGTSNCLPGRIGDSCVIGAGCYANNKTCAISASGIGEVLITGVIAHTISMYMELKQMSLYDAANDVVHNRHQKQKGKFGIIGIDAAGEIVISYNTPCMKTAFINAEGELFISLG